MLLAVKKWAAEIEDGPRKSWLKIAATDENNEKIQNMILDDRRLKMYEMAKDVGNS